MSRVLFIVALVLACLMLYGFYFHAVFYPSWYVKIGSFVASHGFIIAILLLKYKSK